MEPGCNETVELPGDLAVARVSPDYLPPPERQVEIVCPKGHRSLYMLQGAP